MSAEHRIDLSTQHSQLRTGIKRRRNQEMPRTNKHIAALDIGTTEVRAIVGEITENDTLEIIGITRAPSRGVRNAVVVNIEATVHAISHAADEDDMMSGLPIESAYVRLCE